jgi:hypothetical protein
MGCDYYIIKYLEVEYINDNNDIDIIEIELKREKMYFPIDIVSDSDSTDTTDSIKSLNSNEKLKRKYDKYLKVTYISKILFDNNKWKSDNIKEKYHDKILNNIKSGILLKVVKKETRYLR